MFAECRVRAARISGRVEVDRTAVGARIERLYRKLILFDLLEVVVELHQERFRRRVLVDVLERAGVVLELGRQERAQRVRSLSQHTRRAARGTASPPGFARERVQRPHVGLLLEAAEREQAVLDDRTAEKSAVVLRRERPGTVDLTRGLGADERLVAIPRVDGPEKGCSFRSASPCSRRRRRSCPAARRRARRSPAPARSPRAKSARRPCGRPAARRDRTSC